jgi:hypothetical protein
MARKQKTIHYLYKTTCLVTGRYYIGMHSTSNLDDGYMGSGKRLRYSIRKHGVENHVRDILEYFESRELLIEAEKAAITPDMITDNNCMNLKEGGTGGFSVEQQSLNGKNGNKTMKILRETNSEWVTNKAKKQSNTNKEQYKNGIRERKEFFNWSGLTHSEKSKKLMSESSKGMGVGSTNSQYGTCWITKDGVNKKIKKEEIDTFQLEGWITGRK